ncbi:hypothetical protein FQA39_LY02672 [Lamprigera yunnana]|nr:hypothetical protein FQA39_LY02672 [Lamprigera yunnana]
MDSDKDSVQVAVRIRPLLESETSKGCRNILEVYPLLQQIKVKESDRAFTFNNVCDSDMSQDTFYITCVQQLISNLFKGYNVTILAYGQTGSGKTYSMGTAYEDNDEVGIIPRAIKDIFNYARDNFSCDFNISVSFMELYQETLYDLLASKPRDQCVVDIREDPKGLIVIPGLTTEVVTSATNALEFLNKGSRGRVTGCTNMNAQSSRSHAIFSINICMQEKSDGSNNKTAKFYLVDLAGSERSKKTGATGQTFREGVNINRGLLALGNVISVLGGDKQQNYIGYRDSNLTRLLKDSLGGNSITLMIACVSPADYNLDETISTLRYADRARKIKNKPIVNQDPKEAEINRLNKLVTQMRLELIGQGGPIICQSELDQIKKENDCLKMKLRNLTNRLSSTLNENTSLFERVMLLQTANERVMAKLHDLQEEYDTTIGNIEQNIPDAVKEHLEKLKSIQNQFSALHCENQKNEEEIRNHERCINHSNSDRTDLISTETDFCERQESHTKQQLALNCELQEVTKALAMKEYLAKRMLENNQHIVDYKALDEHEKKVESLQKERDELIQQLKNVHYHGPGNKVSEQRRKRVQELEKELQDLHKKIVELTKLIKIKGKNEERIVLLNNEIQQMKTMKVKLIKNMKQESEKFRSWKIQRERELSKLKDQDRKRLNQIVKMETIHNRQQNVLKRKVEEAAAVNKRLKDALALRKNVQDQKNFGKIEKLGGWIQQELDIFISTVDAEATLTHLLEDRTTLQSQLNVLKENSQFGESDEIKQLQEDIELRSTQIQDLQQKVLDSDQGNKSKTRWDNIQTMGEAKAALKFIFDLSADIRRSDINSGFKYNELSSNYDEIKNKCDTLEHRIKNLEAQHYVQLADVAKEHEEKVTVLLRQLRRLPSQDIDEEFQERYMIQQLALEKNESALEEVTERLQQLQEEKKSSEDRLNAKYEELEAEHEKLKARLDDIKQQALTSSDTSITMDTTAVAKKKCEQNNLHLVYENGIPVVMTRVTETSFEQDDIVNDPDWRKTPLAKRIQKIRSSTAISADTNQRLTNKRSWDGACTCRGKCSTKSCGCRKTGNFCTLLCKCTTICENKNIDNEKDLKEEFINEDCKKPRSDTVELNFRSSRSRKAKLQFT